jgi:putative membrane protein
MISQWLSFAFFLTAGLIHVGIFIIESILFQKPGGYKWFKVSEQHHAAVKIWAFNQGFYNLFLALGTFVGLYFIFQKQIMLAGLLTSFCGLSMIGAGVALWFSEPKLRRGALLQILPPLFGFATLALHVVDRLSQR